MGFFNWAAPMIRRFGDRFTPENTTQIANWLRPAVGPGGRVLDVGGGAGQLAVLLARELAASVTVLDPTPEMIDHVPTVLGVSTVRGTAEEMPFPDSEFDAIVVSDAFHHFENQEGAAKEFVRVTRPGGLVLVLELDPRGLVMRLIVLVEKLVGEPGAFLTPDEMCAFMARHGIEGRCEKLQRADYRFIGTVDKPRDAA
jgi:ubiquinone/menaquinone biosynthesis C-methylase UbiE